MNPTDYRPPIEGEPGFIGPSRIFDRDAGSYCEYEGYRIDAPDFLPAGFLRVIYCRSFMFSAQGLVWRGALR